MITIKPQDDWLAAKIVPHTYKGHYQKDLVVEFVEEGPSASSNYLAGQRLMICGDPPKLATADGRYVFFKEDQVIATIDHTEQDTSNDDD